MKKKNDNEICEKENEFDESGINVVIVVFWFCAKVRLTRRRLKKRRICFLEFYFRSDLISYIIYSKPTQKWKINVWRTWDWYLFQHANIQDPRIKREYL